MCQKTDYIIKAATGSSKQRSHDVPSGSISWNKMELRKAQLADEITVANTVKDGRCNAP